MPQARCCHCVHFIPSECSLTGVAINLNQEKPIEKLSDLFALNESEFNNCIADLITAYKATQQFDVSVKRFIWVNDGIINNELIYE